MARKLKRISILLIFLIAGVTIADAKAYKIALFSPKGDSPFWTLVANFANEAANDLGMELQVYDAQLNHLKMVDQVRSAVAGPNKVDAILFPNYKKRGLQILKIAEQANVYALLFNSPIDSETGAGEPREKYTYWLGQMLPDDFNTAQSLTRFVIEAAKNNKKVAVDGKVHLIGVAGELSDPASFTRVSGFREAIRKRSDVVLNQIVTTDWGPKESKFKFLLLLKRYPETTAVWSASYRISDGIVEGIKEQGLNPGKDIFLNTLILNQKALMAIKSGAIVATAGGHYIEAAWLVVLLYDFLHGIDFADEGVRLRTPMGIITKSNVDLYLNKITYAKLSKENLKKIDFTHYSKKLNPTLKKYSFTFDSVISQLQ
jgi:ABC-type sugar transport system substrate-binding protein